MTKDKFNELLHRIRNGDNSALEPIYNEYHSSMQATANFILHEEADAQDAASEALLKLINYAKHRNSDECIENPGGFMYVTVRSCALDILRKKKREEAAELEEVCATNDFSDQTLYKYDLLKALSKLDETERELAIRHFMFDENIKELNRDFDYHYNSLIRKLKEIRKKINKFL